MDLLTGAVSVLRDFLDDEDEIIHDTMSEDVFSETHVRFLADFFKSQDRARQLLLLTDAKLSRGAATSSGWGADPDELTPWQIAHATRAVSAHPLLQRVRDELTPHAMTDEHFWAAYFFNLDVFLRRVDPAKSAAAGRGRGGGAANAPHVEGHAEPARATRSDPARCTAASPDTRDRPLPPSPPPEQVTASRGASLPHDESPAGTRAPRRPLSMTRGERQAAPHATEPARPDRLGGGGPAARRSGKSVAAPLRGAGGTGSVVAECTGYGAAGSTPHAKVTGMDAQSPAGDRAGVPSRGADEPRAAEREPGAVGPAACDVTGAVPQANETEPEPVGEEPSTVGERGASKTMVEATATVPPEVNPDRAPPQEQASPRGTRAAESPSGARVARTGTANAAPLAAPTRSLATGRAQPPVHGPRSPQACAATPPSPRQVPSPHALAPPPARAGDRRDHVDTHEAASLAPLAVQRARPPPRVRCGETPNKVGAGAAVPASDDSEDEWEELGSDASGGTATGPGRAEVDLGSAVRPDYVQRH